MSTKLGAHQGTSIPKYDELISALLKSLEQDYLKSKQLEMVMISPKTGEPIGILDLPLGDLNAAETKAKLTDAEFLIVGKMTRYVNKESSLSLMQRTSISKIVELLGKISDMAEDNKDNDPFSAKLVPAKKLIEKVVSLEIDGPSVRLLAMSISA